MSTQNESEIYTAVNARYGASARATSSTSGKYSQTVAQAFGYSAEELASIPAESNLGLSCGNPIAMSNLKDGETVIDLGSGAGFDVFLAARKVGDKGKAIGVDMNDDMLAKAALNKEKSGLQNVSFIKSKITSIPLPDAVSDVIISNCVINLVPASHKPDVFREMHRLLKPGGRVAVSDLLVKKELPQQMRDDVALYVGCIAGASRVDEYERWLKEAGFEEVLIVDAKADVNVYTQTDEQGNLVGAPCCGDGAETVREKGCCGGGKEEERDGGCCGGAKETKESCCGGGKEEKEVKGCCAGGKTEDDVIKGLKERWANVDLNEWVGSYKIYAVKPSV